MRNSEEIDQDAVLRARVLLLGSGRLDLAEEVGAYRVLARVSPKAYLPKLVDAVLLWSYRTRDRAAELALISEAVEAARRIDADVTGGTERLGRALAARERALFASGRRAEGRAVCEELAAIGRYGRLANVLSEEGRHAEAAGLYDRHVPAVRSDASAGSGASDGAHVSPVSDWTVIEWAAALDAAGRQERALEVFGGLVADRRRTAWENNSPLASLVWALEQYARMAAAAGRDGEAAAARRETLDLLTRLAREGEPVSWSNIQASWVTLFVLSGRQDEPPGRPDAPVPPFGTYRGHGWSADAREAFDAAVPALEERAAALRASGDLAGLVTVHRRLTVRAAQRWQTSGRRDPETLLPAYDEGVALARRLTGDGGSAAARALTDRAMFLLAVRQYAKAREDFAEAAALLDGPTRHGPPREPGKSVPS
ncbi:hypothetical protein ACIGO8_09370 [Streptomyces sp. NPDC053493]|uniref:hypothetical protein n=1 Tax=Streptomyces sp. NPDC053493 TaxID=3365705 RepID=UPI0037CFF528